MPQTLSPPLARSLVLVPTVLLSLYLGSIGIPALQRLLVCVGVAAVLIMLVARVQRRRSF